MLSKRELFEKNKEEIGNATDMALTLEKIKVGAGGSISNLPIKSTYYNAWLTKLQEKNPFIGKGVVSAPEYEISQKEITKATEQVMSDTEMNQMLSDLDKGSEAYEIGKSIGAANVDMDNIKEDPQMRSFMDICTINVVLQKIPNASISDIKDAALSNMRDMYDEPSYVPTIDMEKNINEQILRIEYKKEKEKERLLEIENKNKEKIL